MRLFVALAVAVLMVPGLALGQWLRYPTADVPRTPDGKPNLTAPAPRHPDGTPDFSGIWQPGRGSPLALNIGADLPGGLPFQPWAAALVKQRTAENSKDDPHARGQ